MTTKAVYYALAMMGDKVAYLSYYGNFPLHWQAASWNVQKVYIYTENISDESH